MSEYDEQIPDEEKVKIASDFLLHAPPGEFNEVFNDVRVLLNNDELLKQGASGAFSRYNEEQFTPVKLDGVPVEALITRHALLPNGRYVDPRSKQTFLYDHLRKEASDLQPASDDELNSGYSGQFEGAFKKYVDSHYPNGVSSVYGKPGEAILCVEDHKFQPRNFWNGRWRSEWHITKSTGEVKGVLQAQVHYYEDGNVQLQSKKEVSKTIPADSPVEKFIKVIADAENEYQVAISENYQAMSDTTFKALRRALPITRTKVDWNKILNYRLGKEMSSK